MLATGRKQERGGKYNSPFRDDYRNKVVEDFISPAASPVKTRRCRTRSGQPPTSIPTRYGRDLLADYLSREKRGSDTMSLDTSDGRHDHPLMCQLHMPRIHRRRATTHCILGSRQVSPSLVLMAEHGARSARPIYRCPSPPPPASTPVYTPPDPPVVETPAGGATSRFGIVSEEVRRSKTAAVQHERRVARSISEPVLSMSVNEEPITLQELREMLRSHESTLPSRLTVNVIEGSSRPSSAAAAADNPPTPPATDSEDESDAIGVGAGPAPGYAETVTIRSIPVRSLLVDDVSPLASAVHVGRVPAAVLSPQTRLQAVLEQSRGGPTLQLAVPDPTITPVDGATGHQG